MLSSLLEHVLILILQYVALHYSLPQVLFFLEQQPGDAILVERADKCYQFQGGLLQEIS